MLQTKGDFAKRFNIPPHGKTTSSSHRIVLETAGGADWALRRPQRVTHYNVLPLPSLAQLSLRLQSGGHICVAGAAQAAKSCRVTSTAKEAIETAAGRAGGIAHGRRSRGSTLRGGAAFILTNGSGIPAAQSLSRGAAALYTGAVDE